MIYLAVKMIILYNIKLVHLYIYINVCMKAGEEFIFLTEREYRKGHKYEGTHRRGGVGVRSKKKILLKANSHSRLLFVWLVGRSVCHKKVTLSCFILEFIYFLMVSGKTY